MLKATKVRLYPTAEQRNALSFQFGAARWVYNHALDWRNKAWKEDGERVTRRMTLDKLVELKREEATAWLKEADSQVLQQSLMHLDDAFKRFFKMQARYPRHKVKRGKQSISYPQRVKIVDGNSLYLPKVGNVKAVLHREIAGTIKTVTVSRSLTGKYYASILCDSGEVAPEAINDIEVHAVIGVDMGLSHLLITSEGYKEGNPRFFKQAEANLRRKQRSLSRKMKGSANRNKARILVAKVHERVTNARNDFQHKLSKRLIDDNQAVCVETLKVKNMLKNRKLARPIADASWSELLRKLGYKAVWTGKHLVQVDPWFASSKTCSVCGACMATMPLSVRTWQCKSCGYEHDRDINAARNIRRQGLLKLKAAGLSVSACGGLRKTGLFPAAACEAGSLAL
ncbi:MAG: RNA-guided endonuclease TnpB family protein [Gammaproteobacteria bacterium]|nr:RNA-guided endonuclease TnpB family protein [Gammaproteobacteria bacterium]